MLPFDLSLIGSQMVIFFKSGLYGPVRNELEYRLTSNAIVVLFLAAEIIHALTAGRALAVLPTAVSLAAIAAMKILLRKKLGNPVLMLACLLLGQGVVRLGLSLYDYRAYEAVCAMIPLGWVVVRTRQVSIYLKVSPPDPAGVADRG